MNFDLNYEGFETNLVSRNDGHIGGVQYLFKFDNNYGASIVKNSFSYGGTDDKWELAVMKIDEDGRWNLTYDTPITDDVEGHLTDEEVRDLLRRIKEL